jgi:hypothetical protein
MLSQDIEKSYREGVDMNSYCAVLFGPRQKAKKPLDVNGLKFLRGKHANDWLLERYRNSASELLPVAVLYDDYRADGGRLAKLAFGRITGLHFGVCNKYGVRYRRCERIPVASQ